MNGDQIRYHVFRIFPSLFIFLAAVPLFNYLSKTGDYCDVALLVLIPLFFGFCFIFVCVAVLVFHFFQYYKKGKPFNYYPIIAIALTMIYFGIFIKDHPKEFIAKSNSILFNYTGDAGEENLVYLTNEGEYLFVVGYVEATCYDFGKYQINGDTLQFEEAYIGFSDTLLYTRYILNKKNNWYRPVTDSCAENKFLRFKK